VAIVTLTTDFGLDDHYVGTMKGVILSLHPNATIIDISHAVASYDVLDGALTIAQVYHYFPSGTIHVLVVDPGVGTERRSIVVETERYRFVAPDNGVLSLACEREKQVTVRHANRDRFFLKPRVPPSTAATSSPLGRTFESRRPVSRTR